MNKKLIIFDMDGTLYKFEGGSFRNSGLKKKVLENAAKYIAQKKNVSDDQGQALLEDILNRYDEEISIAVEKELDCDRYDYFNTVWDIPAKDFIQPNSELKDLIKELKEKYLLAVVSDAPAIWTENVLKELKVFDLFEGNIFTGEGDNRKVFGNGFERVIEKFGVAYEETISIGDQEHTDIIPAKKLGMTTIFIGEVLCEHADYSINNILELKSVLSNTLQDTLEQYFSKKDKQVQSITQLPGSSDAKAYLCDQEIYKVGPSKTIQDEVKTFERFKARMKSYESVFPSMEVVQDKSDLSILWIENCGKNSLEDVYKDVSQDLNVLERINNQVLAKIDLIFNETQTQESGDTFFEELVSALTLNLDKAELLDEYINVVDKIKNEKEEYLSSYISSFAHKDLSVGNIIVSDDSSKVRIIDPRLAVPYLDESIASGNVIIDLIGYQVSFLRKEMEVKKDNQGIDFRLINQSIGKAIDEYQDQGVFTEKMKCLALAVWYSVYAACKCDYCTAPERLWLYNEMVRRLKEVLEKL